MLIRNVMTRDVRTIAGDATCAETWKTFQAEGLRRAPVVDGERVLGMITDRDLRRVLPWTIDEQERRAQSGHSTSVRSLLASNLLSVGPNDHLEQAAQIMLEAKIGGLPVLQAGRLVGIVTESDIFKLFVRRSLTQGARRLTFSAPAGPRESLNPAQICVDAGVQLVDLAMYPLDQGRTCVVLFVHTKAPQDLIKGFIAHGYEFILGEVTA